MSSANLGPRRVAVTRPAGKDEDTADLVRSLGMIPFIFHTVELKPLEGLRIREQIRSSFTHGPANWIVFMSSTGVNIFFDSISSDDSLFERLYRANFLAVGPRTEQALVSNGIKTVSVPERYNSDGVSEFFSQMNSKSQRIMLIRFSSADDSLSKSLGKQGAVITTIHAYESIIPTDLDTAFGFLEALSKNQFYGVLFTSRISVSNLFEIAKRKMTETELIDLLKMARIGAIGPATAQELRKRGIEPIVPDEYLIEAALKELINRPDRLQRQSMVS